MIPVEALELALKREEDSITMYQKFAGEFPVAKEIFIFLLNEEEKHKQLIRKKIQELTAA